MNTGHFIKYIIFCAVSWLGFYIAAQPINCAVTYEKWAGRFGDNLFLYAKAQWFSKKFNVPLLYKPFVHSEDLHLHTLEKHYAETDLQKFKNIVTLTKIDSDFQLTDNTLYVIPFYGLESVFTRANYELIKEELKNLIKPKTRLNLIVPPPNTISVAVHIRKGGGFDKPTLTSNAPYKFPPDSFYIEQLKKILTLFPHQTLYVYLFTDDNNPQALAEKYAQNIQSNNIIWDYAPTNTDFNASTLTDFFSIMSFDCLIRPESSFSIWAQRLGKHHVVISPKHITKKDDVWIVDGVYIYSTPLKS